MFVNYDHDKSDSIDMMELTCLLDPPRLYEKIKTDKTTFVEMFAEFDKKATACSASSSRACTTARSTTRRGGSRRR